MNTSNDLLHLISSMTKQEKRYFKLYAAFYNKSSGNSCLRLFEIIDKTRPDTDATLMAAIAHEPFAGRLASLKNQLAELVLDSLAAYQTARKSNFQLRKLLTHIEILYTKGLYSHCRKMLARAEKKALETQQHASLIEIYSWKRSLLIKNASDSFETDIDGLYEQTDSTLSRLMNINNYSRLMDLMQVISARYANRPTPTDLQKLNTIVHHPLLHDTAQAESFDAQLARYNTLGTYSLLTNDTVGALLHYKHAVELWKRFPAMIEDRPSHYQRYLLNYLNCLLSSPDEMEFTAVIQDTRALLPALPDETAALKDIWNIELLYYLNRGQMDKCATVITEVEESLSRHGESFSPPTLVTLCYNCTVFYFLEGRYSRALKHINTILNEHRIEVKRDIQELARMFSLIAHYEMNNLDILENMMRSAKRFLKNRESGPVEAVLMKSIKSLLSAPDRQSIQMILRTLYGELLAILHDENEQEPLGLMELLFWTESTLSNRPVRTLFIEKMNTGKHGTSREIFPLQG